MQKNYNREIRKILSNLYLNLWDNFKKNGKGNVYDPYSTIFMLLYNKKNIQMYDVIINLIYMTGYQDLYIKLRRKEKDKTLSSNDKRMLKILETISETSDLAKLPIKYQFIMKYIIESMIEFNNMNVYQKIVIIKSIDEETKNKLLNINPLFYQDIQNYDIDISLDFIKEKMCSARKTYSEEKLMIDAGNFIKQLVKIKDKSGIRILCELIEEDIKFLNYYFNKISFDDSKMYMSDEIDDMHNRYMYYLNNSIEQILENIKVYKIGILLESSIINSNNLDLLNKEEIEDHIDNNLRNKIMLLNEKKREYSV